VEAFLAGGYWRDLGTPQDYLDGHLDALAGRIAAYRDMERPLVAPSAQVDPASDVRADVVLGERTMVGPGTRVDRSVLHETAVVEEGALVEDSILGPGSTVGAEAEVRGAVLAEGASVSTGVCLEDERLRPGQVAVDGTADPARPW
jgi:mannose-1-phosphate guanylyltransferase